MSVCFCSSGVLLQRLSHAEVAAAADGHPGLCWNTLLLRGGEDTEHLNRVSGIIGGRRFDISIDLFCGTDIWWEDHQKNNPESFISLEFV